MSFTDLNCRLTRYGIVVTHPNPPYPLEPGVPLDDFQLFAAASSLERNGSCLRLVLRPDGLPGDFSEWPEDVVARYYPRGGKHG